MDAIGELQVIIKELTERIEKLEIDVDELRGMNGRLRADLETHENTQYGVHGGKA